MIGANTADVGITTKPQVGVSLGAQALDADWLSSDFDQSGKTALGLTLSDINGQRIRRSSQIRQGVDLISKVMGTHIRLRRGLGAGRLIESSVQKQETK